MRLSFFFVPMLLLQYSIASLAMTTLSNLTTDQSALLAFKARVVDYRSVLTNNWSISYPICSWVGISCGSRHQRVTALNLSDMGLGGTIPRHLGNLSFLVSLDIRENNFHGHLPKELGQLRRLRVMSFAYNKLSGSFPSWIGVLSKLRILSLANNSFTGLIPNSLFNLSRLEKLRAEFNIIGGNIPSRIGNFSKLGNLGLGFSNLPEYGSEGIVSTKCDVYSYGVLLMETFTGKKPTDEMFTGEMSLRRWVKESLPHRLAEVVDANLMREEQAFSAKMDCLLSIMDLALDCCMDTPHKRIRMADAAAKLRKIKAKFLDDVAASS